MVVGVVYGPATSQLCQPHMLTDLELVNVGEGDYRFSGVCLHLLGPFRRSSSRQLTASLSGTWTLPYLVFAELATFLLSDYVYALVFYFLGIPTVVTAPLLL